MIAEPTKGAIVVVSGLIASGKSTVARALCEAIGAERLEADRVRGTLLQASADDDSGPESRWRRDLSQGFEHEIYADLMRRAEAIIGRGEPLVLDACFPLRAQRETVRALAARSSRPFLFVHCRVQDDVRAQRLIERDRASGQAGWAVIDRRFIDHYEPPDELSLGERIDVESDGPTGPIVASIIERLRTMTSGSASLAADILRPRLVSFDCWGTLISEEDWHWAHTLRITALQQAAREAGRDVPFERAKGAFEAAWQRHQQLWHDGRASGAAEIADWGLAALELGDAEAVRTRLVRRFEEASHTGEVVALEGARELLAALSAAGTPCVLVCDTGLTPGRVVRRLLDRHGLLLHLAAQAFSDEVGAPKPDPRPFLAAIERFDVEPTEVLHVGDLRRTDVAGARALGMATARIRARHDDQSDYPDADHVVGSHAELAGLLGLRIGGIERGAR